jgi:hypothetical protein
LQKNLAARIENQDVNRAMQQTARMNLATRLPVNHLVALVDDIKNFFAHAKILEESVIIGKTSVTVAAIEVGDIVTGYANARNKKRATTRLRARLFD